MPRLTRHVVILAAALAIAPAPAAAQQADGWTFTLAPLYLWAMETDGQVSARSATVPVFLDFADAADSLSGAFSFHFEAKRNRWGGFADLNFVQLSSQAAFEVRPNNVPRTVEGDLDFDLTFFEAGASYEVYAPARVAVIGGVRTYTIGAELEFSGDVVSISPVDTSRTSANGFAGLTVRPELSPRWSLVGRADAGGGDADLTWSAMLGVEFRPRPAIGLVFGYRGYGIDISSGDDQPLREYDMTHYGPVVGLNLHWGR